MTNTIAATAVSARSSWGLHQLASLAVSAMTAAAGVLIFSSSNPIALVVLLLLAPFVEETVFRAGMQEWLLRRPVTPWRANLIAACVFALAHVQLRGASVAAVSVIGPALFVGWIYGRYRCLRLCIALHMLMNIVWLSCGSRAFALG
jgi:membrane protease YdiL (CAAX protease family)